MWKRLVTNSPFLAIVGFLSFGCSSNNTENHCRTVIDNTVYEISRESLILENTYPYEFDYADDVVRINLDSPDYDEIGRISNKHFESIKYVDREGRKRGVRITKYRSNLENVPVVRDYWTRIRTAVADCDFEFLNDGVTPWFYHKGADSLKIAFAEGGEVVVDRNFTDRFSRSRLTVIDVQGRGQIMDILFFSPDTVEPIDDFDSLRDYLRENERTGVKRKLISGLDALR